MYKDIVVSLSRYTERIVGARNKRDIEICFRSFGWSRAAQRAVIDLARLASLSVSSIITFPVISVIVVRHLEPFTPSLFTKHRSIEDCRLCHHPDVSHQPHTSLVLARGRLSPEGKPAQHVSTWLPQPAPYVPEPSRDRCRPRHRYRARAHDQRSKPRRIRSENFRLLSLKKRQIVHRARRSLYHKLQIQNQKREQRQSERRIRTRCLPTAMRWITTISSSRMMKGSKMVCAMFAAPLAFATCLHRGQHR
jgi:hypothetical protein